MVYFFSGPEEFQVKGALHPALLEAKSRLGIAPESPVYTIRPQEPDPERVFSYLETASMFESGKIALVEDISRFSKSFREDLLGYLEKRNIAKDASTELFITMIAERESPDALYAYLAAKPVRALILTAIRGADLEKAISREAAARGLKLGPGVAEVLARSHQENVREIAQELEKLALYLRSSREKPKTVTEADLRSIGWERVEEDAWQIIKALGGKNHAAMIRVLLRAFEAGEDELKLLGLLGYIIRAMLVVKDASLRRIHPRDIPRVTKLAPFQVQQYLNASAAFTLEDLKKLYERLLTTDFKIKTGEGKPRILLEKFLLSV